MVRNTFFYRKCYDRGSDEKYMLRIGRNVSPRSDLNYQHNAQASFPPFAWLIAEDAKRSAFLPVMSKRLKAFKGVKVHGNDNYGTINVQREIHFSRLLDLNVDHRKPQTCQYCLSLGCRTFWPLPTPNADELMGKPSSAPRAARLGISDLLVPQITRLCARRGIPSAASHRPTDQLVSLTGDLP